MQSGGLVTVKENNDTKVEVVLGCFTGVSDSILVSMFSGYSLQRLCEWSNIQDI